LLRLSFIAGYVILGVLVFVYFMGMHSNTIDANSLRSLNPFAMFDKSQFTVKGNMYRHKFLIVWLAAIPIGIATIVIFD
jgi:hypothetical protein